MGLNFRILAVESESIYARRGRVQRIVGIRPELHRHPDAIQIPESVLSVIRAAFQNAHPHFNYYGPTEYRGREVAQLISELSVGLWASVDENNRVEAHAAVQKIVEVGEKALLSGKSLLVLGI